MPRRKSRDRKRIQAPSGATGSRSAYSQHIQRKERFSTRNRVPYTRSKEDRLLRREFKRQVVTGTTHPKQAVQKTTVKRGILRSTTTLPECRLRKQYKKRMLKAIAAQVKRSGKGLSAWRRMRRKYTNIIYRC